MHYYKRNIGDYARKAGRLTMLQHGAYTLLLDACYDRERFPTMDEALDWTWASNTEEIEAVQFVLRRFFTLENGVYVQHRIAEEIESYHTKCAKNSHIASEREHQKRTNRARNVVEREPADHESAPNQEPRTNNQEPEKSKTKARSRPADFPEPPDWLNSLAWDAFVQHRRAIRKPMTALAATRCFATLADLMGQGQDPSAVLDQSIQNGWTGIFPLKTTTTGGTHGSHGTRRIGDERESFIEQLTGRASGPIVVG